jgi:DNA repair exonuclease SbcCD nuclease subunit
MNALNKPCFFIPGNHDASIYSHSMIFVKSLNLSNIVLIDKESAGSGISSDVEWAGWKIKFVPYIPSLTMRERDEITYSMIREALISAKKKTIVVGHIHESGAKLGSEQIMLAKGVDVVDVDNYAKEDIILLIGHIHRHQIYKKGNITVCYPGNLYYMDKTDLGQDKGYVLIGEDGSISFEQIKNIRKFVYYNIPENRNVVDFFKGIRIGSNKVIFLTINSDSKIDDTALKEFLKVTGNYYGNVYYGTSELELNKLDINTDKVDPYAVLKQTISDYIDNDIESVKLLGLSGEDVKNSIYNIGVDIYSNSIMGGKYVDS